MHTLETNQQENTQANVAPLASPKNKSYAKKTKEGQKPPIQSKEGTKPPIRAKQARFPARHAPVQRKAAETTNLENLVDQVPASASNQMTPDNGVQNIIYASKRAQKKVKKAAKHNKKFAAALQNWEANPNLQITFVYEGSRISKKTRKKYGLEGDIAGFVVKDGANAYTIYFSSGDPHHGTLGQSSSHRLLEEAYHLDDALGGEQFGGKNKDAFSFNDKGLLGNRDPYNVESDAWLFVADHTDDQPKTTDLTLADGKRVEVLNPLMQQLRDSKGAGERKRKQMTRQYLFGGYQVRLNSPYPQYHNKDIPFNGPYNPNKRK
jgi:hypothetical protein